MNVLVAHNYYQHPGGEDLAYANEIQLLRSRGHHVVPFGIHNDAVRELHPVSAAAKTVWNASVFRSLRVLIKQERIAVCHFHNTFPLISPAAYYAARSEGAAVVQTLHNFRLLCPSATLFRDGQPCEDCIGKAIPWPGVQHACYRQSRPATAVTAAMLSVHRLLQTWSKRVDVYIALTDFAREKLVAGGLPASRIVVKGNFLAEDPGVGSGAGGFALFAGRLVPEKGLPTLIAAWKTIGPSFPLKIVGSGPMAGEVEQVAGQIPGIEYHGQLSSADVTKLLGDATVLVFPSTWYEGLPFTVLQSFAKGTPVIASNLGSMSSLIRHGSTGLHFRAGNVDDLVESVQWIAEHPAQVGQMRVAAREEFQAHYTADQNYRELITVYERAIESFRVTKRYAPASDCESS